MTTTNNAKEKAIEYLKIRSNKPITIGEDTKVLLPDECLVAIDIALSTQAREIFGDIEKYLDECDNLIPFSLLVAHGYNIRCDKIKPNLKELKQKWVRG